MKYFILILLLVVTTSIYAQKKATYVKNNTTYYVDSVYNTTGFPVVKRSSTTKKQFLRQQGLIQTPTGYEIDHIVPLCLGGTDTPDNMQLLTKEEHKIKTIEERKQRKLNKLQ